jgi:chemotaxis protein histidine kinase CheA
LIVRSDNSVADLREVFEFVEDQARIEITPLVADPVAVNEPPRGESKTLAEKSTRESSIRVSTEKIDKVIDLFGEMVITQAMTAELVEQFTPETHNLLKECVATIERCIRELHERTLSVRMLPVGTIALSAANLGSNILVEIDDDGGLDLPRIREKGISKGLISATAEMSDDQIRSLIFERGFSTRSQVSDISGRGVGMDVVKRNVAALNGAINLTSELGKGTSIKILLPLTLAIMGRTYRPCRGASLRSATGVHY